MSDMNFYDFEPIVIDNFFTEEEIIDIYTTKSDSKNFIVDSNFGFITCTENFTENIINKIISNVEKYTNSELTFFGSHMPRYTWKSGTKPQLLPHYDVGLDRTCYTLTIQLDHTLTWPFCVGENCYNVLRNQAILFSGSHQIHWRPQTDFKEDDFYDIIVVQLTENNLPLLDSVHKEKMLKEADYYASKYF